MSGDDLGQWPLDMLGSGLEDPGGSETVDAVPVRGLRDWPGNRPEPADILPSLIGPMRVETARGKTRADELTPGDLVLTRDRGYQPLCWRTQIAPRSRHPLLRTPIPTVRIRAGALGRRLPSRDVIVSASQRIMLSDPRAEALFGEEEVLVAAGDLLHIEGVEPMAPETQEHIALLFDTHEIVRVEGVWTESLLPDDDLLDLLQPEQRAGLRAAQPRLCHATGRAAYLPARLVLNRREARLLGP